MNQKIFIKDCARCGEDHHIDIVPLTMPIGKYSFFAVCPILKEPILVEVVIQDNEIDEDLGVVLEKHFDEIEEEIGTLDRRIMLLEEEND